MENIAEFNKGLLNLITTEQANYFRAIPSGEKDGKLFFYFDESGYTAGKKKELEFLLGRNIEAKFLPAEIFDRNLAKFYPVRSTGKKAKLISGSKDDFLPRILEEAQLIKSSDIHIEVYEQKARIRFRVDGKLVERYNISKGDYPALINKVKILARLDIAEKRLPQDGRISFSGESGEMDLRVSSLPTLNGEKIVLRLLGRNTADLDLDGLGFNEKQLDLYQQSIYKLQGIVLISGPTGSGKTTTLYSTLKLLNREDNNILTIEDPIEYTLEGINQVALKEGIGLTFAEALRTFLRQDPDIIMLGEIRDVETAQMAIRASLTGHLVFSTIHTNSAWGTISRLIDMGIPSYLVANTLNISVAQRLVRLLCSDCKKTEKFEHDDALKIQYAKNIKKHTVAVGCDKCYYTGYRGRKAIYEMIPVNIEISDLIKSGNDFTEEVAENIKFHSLKEEAMRLFKEGQTNWDEVLPYLIT